MIHFLPAVHAQAAGGKEVVSVCAESCSTISIIPALPAIDSGRLYENVTAPSIC